MCSRDVHKQLTKVCTKNNLNKYNKLEKVQSKINFNTSFNSSTTHDSDIIEGVNVEL